MGIEAIISSSVVFAALVVWLRRYSVRAAKAAQRAGDIDRLSDLRSQLEDDEDGLRVEAAYLLADVCDALHLTPRQTQHVMGSGFWLLEAPVSEPTDKEEC